MVSSRQPSAADVARTALNQWAACESPNRTTVRCCTRGAEPAGTRGDRAAALVAAVGVDDGRVAFRHPRRGQVGAGPGCRGRPCQREHEPGGRRGNEGGHPGQPVAAANEQAGRAPEHRNGQRRRAGATGRALTGASPARGASGCVSSGGYPRGAGRRAVGRPRCRHADPTARRRRPDVVDSKRPCDRPACPPVRPPARRPGRAPRDALRRDPRSGPTSRGCGRSRSASCSPTTRGCRSSRRASSASTSSS